MKFSKQKIVDIFDTFSPLEFRKLNAFLDSPYHVKPRDKEIYLKLMEAIVKSQISPNATGGEEKKLFAFLYPEKEFVSGKVEKKMSQFINVLLEFIGQEEVKKSKAIELATLKSLRIKGLSKLYLKEIKKTRKNFQKNGRGWIDGSLANFELDLEACRFLNMDPAVTDQDGYNAVYQALDHLYVNYYIYLGLRNLNYNSFSQPKVIESKFDKLKFMLDRRNPAQISKTQKFEEKLFRILLDTSIIAGKKIEELAAQLETIKKVINIESYKNYRTLIRSFTVAQYNSGDLSLGPFILQLYKQEVANKSIFFKNKIPSAIANNIVNFIA